MTSLALSDNIRAMNKTTPIINNIEPMPSYREWLREYKRRRREFVMRLYDNGNGMSMTKIANVYGLSKQRIQQIIRSEVS